MESKKRGIIACLDEVLRLLFDEATTSANVGAYPVPLGGLLRPPNFQRPDAVDASIAIQQWERLLGKKKRRIRRIGWTTHHE